LEDFSFDMTGQQALDILSSEEIKEFHTRHDRNIPVLVEGRVGIIEKEGSTTKYIEALKEAGAMGAIVGGGIAVAPLESLLSI
jgi:hypothetical protein